MLQYSPREEGIVQTLYIDVYFLINFTVDFIALYFAAVFSKVPTSAPRLLIASFVGGISSVIYILSPETVILKIFIAVIGLCITVYLSSGRVKLFRRIRTGFAFLMFSSLIGGGVNLLYGLFDKYLYGYLKDTEGGAQNRNLLILSIIVLISIGVFKMLVSFFTNIESEGARKIKISLLGKNVITEAFLDSGNLAIDPMDMRPIMFIKPDLAEKLLPRNVIELTSPDELERDFRKRIRLIPITRGGETHVLTGIRADSVKLLSDGNDEEISVTIAIDKVGGSYGGYDAMLPSSVINNA
jgi:sigma-E processing peptidase SpoIIGA